MKAATVELRPTRGLRSLALHELWTYRELAFFLVWRDVKVRYKQTVFGALWAVMQPFALMIVFTFVFGRVLDVQTAPGIPKPLFYFAALVPWTLFSSSLVSVSNGIISAAGLIRKIYFPRLILPIAATGAYLIDFFIALTFLFIMMFFYGFGLNANMIWLPVLTLLGLATALAVGLWFAALNSRYRDVGYAVPFLVNLWLFLTPVINQSSQVDADYRAIYFLNPMAGVVEGFRWALLDAGQAPGMMTLISTGMTLLLLVGGVYYFRSAERTFADVI